MKWAYGNHCSEIWAFTLVYTGCGIAYIITIFSIKLTKLANLLNSFNIFPQRKWSGLCYYGRRTKDIHKGKSGREVWATHFLDMNAIPDCVDFAGLTMNFLHFSFSITFSYIFFMLHEMHLGPLLCYYRCVT